MKKILIILLFSVSMILSSVFAQAKEYEQDKEPVGLLGENQNIVTYTSEPCGIAGENGGMISGSGQNARYKCYVSAQTGFIDFISSIYRYIFFISLVIGVLMIVVLGITMSIWGISGDMEESVSERKKQIMDILFGLIALAMVPWIFKTVAPFFFT